MIINNIDELDLIIENMSNHLIKEKGKYEKIKEQLNSNKKESEEITLDLDLLEKVNILFQRTSEFARNQAKIQIESLVTNCLQFVFADNLEFEIEIKESNGRPSAKFFVVTQNEDNEIRLEPELSRGGGVVDVVSLALRIAFLEIHKPKIEGPLMLDEPAKHVSSDYIFNVSNFLKKVSELFGRQIIMITHDDFLAAIGDRSYNVALKDGVSYIEESELVEID